MIGHLGIMKPSQCDSRDLRGPIVPSKYSNHCNSSAYSEIVHFPLLLIPPSTSDIDNGALEIGCFSLHGTICWHGTRTNGQYFFRNLERAGMQHRDPGGKVWGDHTRNALRACGIYIRWRDGLDHHQRGPSRSRCGTENGAENAPPISPQRILASLGMVLSVSSSEKTFVGRKELLNR
jgi:hypothetical protein